MRQWNQSTASSSITPNWIYLESGERPSQAARKSNVMLGIDKKRELQMFTEVSLRLPQQSCADPITYSPDVYYSTMRAVLRSSRIPNYLPGSASMVMCIGAHPEYHVWTRRHSEAGLSVITVSSIESGAGSVLVSARPALPST